ncbi:hypothetical protein [Actinopolyspora mortivallis]|uniref:hypothetical protein n=1 Tax=Actinopolyspora mortivallis TaxID=33906 RepID=UPI000360D378|nr:hypothetical protein [Actinopolyspora mortivallis]
MPGSTRRESPHDLGDTVHPSEVGTSGSARTPTTAHSLSPVGGTDTRLPHPTRVTVRTLWTLLALGAVGVTTSLLEASIAPHSRGPDRAEEQTRVTPVRDSEALRLGTLFDEAGWPGMRPGDSLPEEAARFGNSRGIVAENHVANPSAGSARSATRLVRKFYRLLEDDPARALTLVSIRLTDRQRTEIVHGWSTLGSVEAHEITVTAEGRVLATVAVDGPADTRIALRHSFSVTPGSDPTISRVWLRAARLRHVAG